ncbi:hypothetical protein OTU49_012737 [Cherax quadricarinatus]|uniref:Uncharacterized protein n=1 Tax=Cherax quadricarinatus TaxID=27406 RepID=A0AAW0VWQ0_CHEQU|nr:uncharacterized protein LOC128704684 [Cherax quadricarinatus]
MALRLWNMRVLWSLTSALNSRLGFICQPRNFYGAVIWHRKQACSTYVSQSDNINNINIKERSLKILNKLQSKGIYKYCCEKHTAELYQLLLDLGIKSKTIETQILNQPDILGFTIKHWTDICEVFVDNGISSTTILQNIALQPQILKLKPSALRQIILKYREIKVGTHNVLPLINRYPMLYLCPPEHIKKRLELLASLFPPSDLRLLISNNPEVLFNKWEDIMKKIMYIHKEMGLEQPHMTDCSVFTRSLFHIKTRHQFLHRAGLYKFPNLKKDKDSYKINSSLSDIMDTTDKYFANKVAKLSDEEYAVFVSIMEEEEKLLQSDEEDESDEDDILDD